MMAGTATKLVSPSFLGGHNWHPMSFNPKTGLVYIPAQESVAGMEPQKEPLFIPNKSVVNLGLEVPDLPEDPKIEAAIEYLEKTPHGQTLITNPENIERALNGETGTWIVNE